MSDFRLEWVEIYLPKRAINVIFDIGSNNGYDGLRFKVKYPKSRVISIEADYLLYNNMINNKMMNSLEIFNYAVCDHDGTIIFYHNNGKHRSSGSIHEPTEVCYKYEGMSFSNPYEIPSIRLNTLCKKQNINEIDIIHMDIQGAEYDALISLDEIRPKMIFLEVFACNNKEYNGAKSTTNKLIEMGYEKIDVPLDYDELWIYNNKAILNK